MEDLENKSDSTSGDDSVEFEDTPETGLYDNSSEKRASSCYFSSIASQFNQNIKNRAAKPQ